MASSLRGIRILVDFVVNSLHKIARGRGTLKGAIMDIRRRLML
jgi:hypothetical protein